MERVNLPSKILLIKLIFLAGELFSQDRCQMKRVKSYGKFCFVVEVRQITPHAVLESPQLQDAPVKRSRGKRLCSIVKEVRSANL
jgi:hypothetical protein